MDFPVTCKAFTAEELNAKSVEFVLPTPSGPKTGFGRFDARTSGNVTFIRVATVDLFPPRHTSMPLTQIMVDQIKRHPDPTIATFLITDAI